MQHREVMMHESQEFNALFKQINYLKGGVASGFNHVEEGACGTMSKGPPWYIVPQLASLAAWGWLCTDLWLCYALRTSRAARGAADQNP